MAVSFNRIPQNIRLPLFWAEIDPSMAGTYVIDEPALLVGQKLSTGSALAAVPVQVATADEAAELFGRGSMLARMVDVFRRNNSNQTLWALPLAEPGAGVVATGKIAIAGPATAAGILTVYIAGQRIQAAVSGDDTAADVATALAAAIAAAPDLPVTATVTGEDNDEVTLTCRWKGLTGNDVTIIPNRGGRLAGEVLPTGITLTVTAMAAGAGAPDVAGALGNLGDEPFDAVAFPFTDTVSLDAFRDEWSDQDGGRWAWDRQIYGHGYSAARGSHGALAAVGNARNDPHITISGLPAKRPTPVWEYCAAAAAQAARALMNDPARPLQTLPLVGVLAEPLENRFTAQERNTLLYDGIATDSVRADGTVQIERMVTTYQKNAYGMPDNAYLDVTTLATLARVLRSMKGRITSKYPRHKLANDGTRFGPGQAVVTPNVIRAELVAHYRWLEEQGLVENARAFKENLIVERDINDPNRLNVLYPPDLVNQLTVFAVLAQFRLQYEATAA